MEPRLVKTSLENHTRVPCEAFLDVYRLMRLGGQVGNQAAHVNLLDAKPESLGAEEATV